MAAAAAAAATAAFEAAVAIAHTNATDFFRVLDLPVTDEEYATWATSPSSKSVGDVLGVGDDFIDARKQLHKGNATFGWDGLRGVFRREWVKRHDLGFWRRLFDGKVACAKCHQHTAKSGIVSTKKNKLDDHEAHEDHVARAEAQQGAVRQPDLVEMGFAPTAALAQRSHVARALVVGRLVAGAGGEGHGAAGLPPTSIPALFNADLMTVRGELPVGGCRRASLARSRITVAPLFRARRPPAGHFTSGGWYAARDDDPRHGYPRRRRARQGEDSRPDEAERARAAQVLARDRRWQLQARERPQGRYGHCAQP